MNREDCEKLLDAFEQVAVIAERAGKDIAVDADEAHDNLREVIIGIMAGEKKPVYRDGGIAAPGTIRWDGRYTTIPTPLTRPVVTCDGKGEITAMTATWNGSDDRDGIAYDLGRLDERKRQIQEEMVKTCS